MIGQKFAREQPASVVGEFKDMKIVCQDCSDEFPFSALQQADFWRRGHEDPKRCKKCLIAKKARFADFNKGSPNSQDKPKAGMPEDSQASSGSGGWVWGGTSGGSDGWGRGGKKGGKGK